MPLDRLPIQVQLLNHILDGGVGERMNLMYNDSKHMNERIDAAEIPPEATSSLWITNSGLESFHSSVTFSELVEELRGMADLADDWRKSRDRPRRRVRRLQDRLNERH